MPSAGFCSVELVQVRQRLVRARRPACGRRPPGAHDGETSVYASTCSAIVGGSRWCWKSSSVRNSPTPSTATPLSPAALPMLASSATRCPSAVPPRSHGRRGGQHRGGDVAGGAATDTRPRRADDGDRAVTDPQRPGTPPRRAGHGRGPGSRCGRRPADVTTASTRSGSSSAASAGARSTATSTYGQPGSGRVGIGSPRQCATTRSRRSSRSAARRERTAGGEPIAKRLDGLGQRLGRRPPGACSRATASWSEVSPAIVAPASRTARPAGRRSRSARGSRCRRRSARPRRDARPAPRPPPARRGAARPGRPAAPPHRRRRRARPGRRRAGGRRPRPRRRRRRRPAGRGAGRAARCRPQRRRRRSRVRARPPPIRGCRDRARAARCGRRRADRRASRRRTGRSAATIAATRSAAGRAWSPDPGGSVPRRVITG